jgi:putative membrane protein
LYNGFLAAGILWAFLKKDLDQAFEIKVFFVSCVIVAALYGAYSVDSMILIKQGAPAIIALIFLILLRK